MRSFCTTLAILASSSSLLAGVLAQTPTLPEGVLATGTQGPTNPPEATLGTPINQTSYARLISINAIDDFCVFAPPTLTNISESESYEVAWCTKPRNNARVIPDGTFTALRFIKTDMYVQLMGYGNLTNLNIPNGDWGGELDPHGATGEGNPVGGNVTSDVYGSDLPFAEWMEYISYEQFCLRVCINANATYSAPIMCEHTLDVMGCEFVMPGDYNFQGFETCEADVAYPPGVYPVGTTDGVTEYSTFAQRWTGTIDGVAYTVGDLVTPAAPYFTPSSSNCVSVSTISNGIPLSSLGFTSAAAPTATGASGSGTPSRSGAGTQPTSGSGSVSSNSSGNSSAAAGGRVALDQGLLMTVAALMGTLLAVMVFH